MIIIPVVLVRLFEKIDGDIISGEMVRCELTNVIDSKLTFNSFPLVVRGDLTSRRVEASFQRFDIKRT